MVFFRLPSNLFILFHPFSSFFFEKGRKRQKKAEKGRDRSEIMVRSFGSNNCWISDKNCGQVRREIEP